MLFSRNSREPPEMTPLGLLVLAPREELADLGELLEALRSVGMRPVVPQHVTRIGDSTVAMLDKLVSSASAALIVNSPLGSDDLEFQRACYSFRARVARRSQLKELVLDHRGATSPPHRYGSAIVIPEGIAAAETAKLIKAVLALGGQISTLRAPPYDNLNAPFLSAGAWPLSFLKSLPLPNELADAEYDEALFLYWSGLNKSGYLGDWRSRLISSRRLIKLANDNNDLASKSLILTKGVAYAQIVGEQAASARNILYAAAQAARSARDKRAHSYAVSYLGDVAALDGSFGNALKAYDEAVADLRGLERHELLLKRELLTRLNDPSGRLSSRLRSLDHLKEAFAEVMNYREGSVMIEQARELALSGASMEALDQLDVAQAYFRDTVPMPRNLAFATGLREAILRGDRLLPKKVLW